MGSPALERYTLNGAFRDGDYSAGVSFQRTVAPLGLKHRRANATPLARFILRGFLICGN